MGGSTGGGWAIHHPALIQRPADPVVPPKEGPAGCKKKPRRSGAKGGVSCKKRDEEGPPAEVYWNQDRMRCLPGPRLMARVFALRRSRRFRLGETAEPGKGAFDDPALG
jgi:hypothetical protein